MTDTQRRALLGALALAPVVGAVPAAAAPVLGDLSALDEVGLWEAGTRCADAAFASLCAAAIETEARAVAADRAWADAAKRADPARADLARAADAALNEASNARWAVLRYPACSADVLRIKLALRLREAVNAEEPDEIALLSGIASDVARVLG